VAPILFLWAELTVVRLAGFSEWTLRLLPFAFALASIVIFRYAAAHLLRGPALVLAVGTFAVTYWIVRHSSEVKPYSVDVLMTVVLIWLTLRWWRDPTQSQRLWLLTAFVPLAVGLSYPAVFTAGGISVFAFFALRSASHRRAWLAWVGYNVALTVHSRPATLSLRRHRATRRSSGCVISGKTSFLR